MGLPGLLSYVNQWNNADSSWITGDTNEFQDRDSYHVYSHLFTFRM